MKKSAVFAFAAGLMGGLAAQYLTGSRVLAQNPAPAPSFVKEVRAQNFTLIDQNNQPEGTFSAERAPGLGPNRTRIVLRNARGTVIWSAGGDTLSPISAK